MPNNELMHGLNHALNREVSTFLRYMLQAAKIHGAQWDSARNLYLSEVKDEMRHAQYLANKIVALGGTPELSPDLTAPPGKVEEMIRHDADEEKIDAEHYQKMAKLAEEESLPDLKVQMEEQAADEARHREELERLLA